MVMKLPFSYAKTMMIETSSAKPCTGKINSKINSKIEESSAKSTAKSIDF